MSAQPPVTKFFDNNGMLLHHAIGRQGEGHEPSGINVSMASEEMKTTSKRAV
jgi:hypothetical protein